MGKPGSGRYTTYLSVKSGKTDLLSKLFKGGFSGLYSGAEDNSKAAESAVSTAKSVLDGKGDPDMFGSGIDLSYGTAPNTTEVKWGKAGDPANPYVPDLSSPGPGKTEGTQKDADPGLKPEDVKPNFDSKNTTINTTSPSATAASLGNFPIGRELTGGKSSV